MRFRAILFDKDGTLFDFHRTWAGVGESSVVALTPDPAVQDRLAALGGFDRARKTFLPGAPMVAGTLREVAEIWQPHLPEHSVAGIERLLDEIAIEATRNGALVPAVDHFGAFLTGLQAAGYALGIATHDSLESTQVQLDAADVRGLFDFVAGYDSGHGMKPGPGMLHAFAHAVSVAPAEVVMVGDSVGDLQMVGNAGGGLAVGVLSGPAEADDLAPYADYVLPTIGDLPGLLHKLAAQTPN
ncbi:MAG: HAD family hydrolase [Pseudomonadota bacterium]